MKYKLNPLFTLRKTDKAVFNFSRAELTQFNDTGFDILLAVLEQKVIESGQMMKMNF
ncbi:hypothetical protein AAAV47_12735 [Staphylococcus hominis]